MSINLERILELSLSEPKTEMERFLKLSEECGELAQEILISQNASGLQYKEAGADGVCGEAVDVLLVALSICFKSGCTISKLEQLIEKKSAKWSKYQRSRP